MAWYSVVVIIVLIQQAAAQDFNPDLVKVTCDSEPSYTLTISGQVDTGTIFIDGSCAQQSTTNTDNKYTFSPANCEGGIPPLGEEFEVRISELSKFGLNDDGVFLVTCDATTSSIEKTVTLETSDKAGVPKTGTADPPELDVISFVEGSEATIGNVGDSVEIKVTLTDADKDVYGTKIISATATKTGFEGSVQLITEGCTNDAKIVTQPGLSTDGVLSLLLRLFIPINTQSKTPQVVTTNVIITLQIQFCPGACEAADCSGGGRRRRRRADDNNSTVQTMEYAKTFTVYPTGHKKRQREEITKTGTAIDSSVCLARASFYGVISALLLVLVVCVAISACMFYRLRKGPVYKGSDTSYKNKAFY